MTHQSYNTVIRINKRIILSALAFTLILTPMISQHKEETTIKVQCDPETGLCAIPDFDQEQEPIEWKEGEEIIYIGDPMCSWCWGMSPELNALQRYGAEQGIPFTLLMGGLRPESGQKWDDEFKNYLKHHWTEVNKRTGQPFDHSFFDKSSFDYNTEPACRGIVTARAIAPEKALAFYEHAQHYFYAKAGDPHEVSFYKPICEELSIDYGLFSQMFESEEMKQQTLADFNQSRQWGVRAFPSIVYRKDDQLYLIAEGYAKYEGLKKSITDIKSEAGK